MTQSVIRPGIAPVDTPVIPLVARKMTIGGFVRLYGQDQLVQSPPGVGLGGWPPVPGEVGENHEYRGRQQQWDDRRPFHASPFAATSGPAADCLAARPPIHLGLYCQMIARSAWSSPPNAYVPPAQAVTPLVLKHFGLPLQDTTTDGLGSQAADAMLQEAAATPPRSSVRMIRPAVLR